MNGKKLIIPAEFKVCATCTYWDGERRVDEEINVVVFDDAAKGECLVTAEDFPALHMVRHDCDCLWEELRGDVVDNEAADLPLKSD
jgi:hypothetical protein